MREGIQQLGEIWLIIFESLLFTFCSPQIRDRIQAARSEYKQLLMETKLISHKSLQMIKDKEGSHMEEIEEILSKDSRYHVLEVLNDDRADLLMEYLEELEKRGPPPPPTASEPNRRK